VSSESDFVAASDRVLGAIGAMIDGSGTDLDWSENDGVLTIECPDGTRLIVNRHLPNRELWVAARSGGFHFRNEGGRWRDSRSGEDLSEALARLLQLQAGVAIDFGALPAAPTS
jgi:CyaY protein